MTAYTGAIVGAASTTVAATTIRTQMQTTVPSHSNWTLVESTTMNAGVVPCDVYKCAAAGNGFGHDFYVGVMQNGANIHFGIAEGYNASTHRPQRPAMRATSALQTLQADGGVVSATAECDWFNGTINPGGGSLTVSASQGNTALTPATTDDYMIIVAADALFLWERAGNGVRDLYAGAYDSWVPTPATNDPLPLVVARFNTSGSSGLATVDAMRMPLCGGLSRGWACGCNGAATGELSGSNTFSTDLSVIDLTRKPFGLAGGSGSDIYDLYNGGLYAARYPILNSYTNASATLGRDLNGWYRGTYRHLRTIPITTGVVGMDTITVDGVSYVFTPHSSSPFTSPPCFWYEANPA